MSPSVAILGSGMAGLACARTLGQAGWAPVVLDKGRSVGGRMATRTSRQGWQFDHGAQFVTAREPAFAELLQQMQVAGWADRWDDGGDCEHWVGMPDMGALMRYLAQGLDLRQGISVTSIAAHGDGWRLAHSEGTTDFDRVVVTLPAPQVPGLLGADHPLVGELAAVELAPTLTLMAGLDPEAPRPFAAAGDDGGPLSWIAQDSSKPGRARQGGTAWVAHARSDWSATHLERDTHELADAMLPLLLERIGAAPEAVRYAAAHRWRYARVTAPLGRNFLTSACATLYLGGDWCLGPRVEAAWQSGRAIAGDLLAP